MGAEGHLTVLKTDCVPQVIKTKTGGNTRSNISSFMQQQNIESSHTVHHFIETFGSGAAQGVCGCLHLLVKLWHGVDDAGFHQRASFSCGSFQCPDRKNAHMCRLSQKLGQTICSEDS